MASCGRRFPSECMTSHGLKDWKNCQELLRYYTYVLRENDTDLEKVTIIPSIMRVVHGVFTDFPNRMTSSEVTDAMTSVTDAMKLQKSEYWRNESDYKHLSKEFEILNRILNETKAAPKKKIKLTT